MLERLGVALRGEFDAQEREHARLPARNPVLDCRPAWDDQLGGVAAAVARASEARAAREAAVGATADARERAAQPRAGFGRGMFQALRYRDYRLLWNGNVLTQTGQWMQQVALGWLVLELTGSPTFLGLVGFARGIPMLFLSLPAGVLADRVDRRRLLIVAQVLAAALALLLAVLVVTDLVRPWHVLVLSFLSGSVMSFIFPTRQALVPNLVPREHVANAVALNSAGQNSTRVIGPSLAGALIGAVGTAVCFFIQAGGLVLAALMSVRMRVPARPAQAGATSTRAGSAGSLVEGLRYIRASPTLSGLIGLAAVPTVLALPYIQMLPVVAREELGTGSTGLGLLMTASGIGALAGSLIYAAMGEVRQTGRWLVGTATGFGLVLAIFAQVSWLPLALLLAALTSVVSSIYMSLNNTTLHLSVSDALRGRVMAVYLMTWGFQPFGTLPMGALADAFGAPVAIAAGGLASSALVLLIAWRWGVGKWQAESRP